MDRLLLVGAVCYLFARTWGLVGYHTGIRWTDDVIECPVHSLVVIENAFFSSPSTTVCDVMCRRGPDAQHEDECYFKDHVCVQRPREEQVALLYDFCWPTAAPTWCNFSDAALPESLNVGITCLEGNVFDPFNQTFSWKSHKVSLVFRHDFTPLATMVTHCQIHSDAQQPSLKITALRSPLMTQASNVTSSENDITVVVGDVRTSVKESRFPHWWMVRQPLFEIELKMVVTDGNVHPFWISLEDSEHKFELLCRHMDVTSSSVTTSVMTSPTSTSRDVIYADNSDAFSLRDMVVAVVCSVVVMVITAVTVYVIRYCRRKRRSNDEDYSALDTSVQFHNYATGSVTIGNNVTRTGASCRGPCPRPPTTSPSNCLPRGSGVSSGLYVEPGDLDLEPKQPTCSADDTTRHVTSANVAQPAKDVAAWGGGGGGGGGGDVVVGESGEGWWYQNDGVTGEYENTQYEEIPALAVAGD